MSCKSTNEPEKYAVTDGKALQKNIFPKDTLHVVTQYGATSYFIYRDEVLGYDYELAQNLAAHLLNPVRCLKGTTFFNAPQRLQKLWRRDLGNWSATDPGENVVLKP